MEEGESEQECLARELFEEFGIKAEIGAYLCSSFFENKGLPFKMRAYYVPSFSGEIKLYDHQAVRWVDIQNLLSYDMPEPDRPIVEMLLQTHHLIK